MCSNTPATPVSVIVSRYANGHAYDKLQNLTCSGLKDAMYEADKLRTHGVSVIVRPNYNETDAEGRYFREWRSLDGTPFKECKWRF
jgi:hypothetical protein